MFLSPRQYFRSRESSPRKRLGQHFLSQPATARRIVESADIEPSDVVVEVGPGLGALTQVLLPEVRRLHLVELDRSLADYLESHMPPSPAEVRIHRMDVLDFDFAGLSRSEGKRLVVIGNLPYNISSPLMFHILDSAEALERGVFMVQKEVGERLSASPGTKDYGVLSVLLGIYARVTPLFDVGRGQFYPPPRVESMVLRIDFPDEPPADAPPFPFMRKVVNTAFQQRRKTLHNNLKSLVGREPSLLPNLLSTAGIDPNRRAETLTAREFVRLAEALRAHIG